MTMHARRREGCVHRGRGFTLVEAVISIVIMGVLMAAALNGIGYAARDRRGQADMRRGRALISAMAREIMAQRYAEPNGVVSTPAGGGSRTDFNSIRDYAGLTERPPLERDGRAVPGATGWTRTVTIEGVDIDVATMGLTAARPLNAVMASAVITATSPTGKTYQTRVYRSAWGAADVTTPAAGLAIGLNVKLTSGSGEKGEETMTTSIDLENQPSP